MHRPAWPDYIAVKRFDAQGRVIGECGIAGLYTSGVYTESPWRIPLLRRKVQAIVEASGFDPGGFDGKVLRQVLATYPRDELFQSSDSELSDTAMQITRNHERNRLQVFVRAGRYGMFFSCLVYTPRRSTRPHCARASSTSFAMNSAPRIRSSRPTSRNPCSFVRTSYCASIPGNPGAGTSGGSNRACVPSRAIGMTIFVTRSSRSTAKGARVRSSSVTDRHSGPAIASASTRAVAVSDIGQLERLPGGSAQNGTDDLVLRPLSLSGRCGDAPTPEGVPRG